MNQESFDRDLERFERMIMTEFNMGISDLKEMLDQRERKLRSDMQNAIAGAFTYIRNKHGKKDSII